MDEIYVTFFWSVLAIGFSVLSLLSWYLCRKPFEDLKIVVDTPGGIYVEDDKAGIKIKYETPIYDILKIMMWVNFIAFLLAGLSALLSGGLL